MRSPLLLIFSFLAFFLCTVTSYAWTGKVVGISDGDTIKVIHNGEQVKIRLYGIDTPEKKQAHGKAAKRFTVTLVEGKEVVVDPVAKDRYRRTVGLVRVDNKLVNEEIVRAGYGWVYRRYCKKDFCSKWLDLETQARSAKIGLWADPDPVSPWEWRHGKKEQKVTSKSDGLLHGNTKSHVFHRPRCKHYSCKNCMESFKDRTTAIKAGYRPCGLCKP